LSRSLIPIVIFIELRTTIPIDFQVLFRVPPSHRIPHGIDDRPPYDGPGSHWLLCWSEPRLFRPRPRYEISTALRSGYFNHVRNCHYIPHLKGKKESGLTIENLPFCSRYVDHLSICHSGLPGSANSLLELILAKAQSDVVIAWNCLLLRPPRISFSE
jgi:hypothetical protein